MMLDSKGIKGSKSHKIPTAPPPKRAPRMNIIKREGRFFLFLWVRIPLSAMILFASFTISLLSHLEGLLSSRSMKYALSKMPPDLGCIIITFFCIPFNISIFTFR